MSYSRMSFYTANSDLEGKSKTQTILERKKHNSKISITEAGVVS